MVHTILGSWPESGCHSISAFLLWHSYYYFCKFNATILKQHACTDSLNPLAPCRHKDQNTSQYIETHAAVLSLYSGQSFSGTTHPRVHLPPTANVRRDTDRCTGGLFYNEIFLANISLRTDFKPVDFCLGQCRDSQFFRIDGWIAGFPCGNARPGRYAAIRISDETNPQRLVKWSAGRRLRPEHLISTWSEGAAQGLCEFGDRSAEASTLARIRARFSCASASSGRRASARRNSATASVNWPALCSAIARLLCAAAISGCNRTTCHRWVKASPACPNRNNNVPRL